LIGAFGWLYRTVVSRAALLMIAGWIAVAVLLPRLASAPQDTFANFGGLLPSHSSAVQAEHRALQEFRLPLNPATCVVVHEPHRLDPLARADAYAWALSFTQEYLRGKEPATDEPHILAAVPMPTITADTVVTYLYVSSDASQGDAVDLAHRYAAHFHRFPGVQTYVTGLAPAQEAQQQIISDNELWFRILSIVAVVLIVTLTFRSIIAALVVLLAAGAAYLAARASVYLLASHFGFSVNDQIDPVVVALVLGVVTDYAMLFFQDFRERLASGLDHGAAVRATLKHEAPVVTIAGLTVAGGTAALLAADLKLFRAFGPALSLSVLIGLAASLTLTPAIMTVLGHRLLRPRAKKPETDVAPTPSRTTRLIVRATSRRTTAAAIVAVSAIALLAVGALAMNMRFGASFASGLPAGNEVRQGADVLERDGIHGVTGPTDVLIEAPHITSDVVGLARLQLATQKQPGVAEVFGPADFPVPSRKGVIYSPSGNAARMIVIYDSDPLAAEAISDVRHLQDRLPDLAAQAGLPSDVRLSITGETAIAGELSDITGTSLMITVLVAIGIEFLILALFLRALVTPLVLLASSALTVAAAFGLTTWFFQDVRGDESLTFYAPFATAVLLFSLGSDYNIFAVGNIWQEARRRPLGAAIRAAMPRSSRAIAAAGITLAATMAMVALIPIETFREVAFTMTVGLLIDTLLVRPLVVPALLTLLGRVAGWPGGRIRPEQPPATEGTPAVASVAPAARGAP
jgi:RND superfamily putative drug exporter